MTEYRIERDSMGEVQVPVAALWGAQTQRSLENFEIGQEKMPMALVKGLIALKKACAQANLAEGKLTAAQGQAIVGACDSLLSSDEYDRQFPLCLWQTGSGTQTNMNVNEVIANLANQQTAQGIHPNDHVNMSQSSNDVFPTAMHIAAYHQLQQGLVPEMKQWLTLLKEMTVSHQAVLKIGRTHLQDATPLTFGQEISGWQGMIENSLKALTDSSRSLLPLAIGGTAVGTGINASQEFGQRVSQNLASAYGYEFSSDPNKFFALTSHQPLSYVHGSLRSLASDLMKIANDIRWLASGPRCGIGEITIPSNEPGSSIMPGKVNPTQAEALTMIVAQVMGNDMTIQVAASQGNFELNVFKPVIIYNYLQTVTLLTDGMRSFREKCLVGLRPNQEVMGRLLSESLMLVTALSPYIGYEKSAEIAKKASVEGTTLTEAALALGYATASELEEWLDPRQML
ncbi:class II fumarate hydratase [Vagococcus sp. BWB3-3]|uniref:Fumarate hydratase class II n=1 Tax=Vagococcus allomyrinae TaxID=2794353 RepID=A0A940SUU7_9ENTE|nr:class II fumarate hydratase [Vagococcus allomyrinae]MBP1041189.1 class II fumarate hydratase [Vagococcus allomyrinae]